MNTDSPKIYKTLKAGPSCRKPDCGASCDYAYACQHQFDSGSASMIVPLVLLVTVVSLATIAFLGG